MKITCIGAGYVGGKSSYNYLTRSCISIDGLFFLQLMLCSLFKPAKYCQELPIPVFENFEIGPCNVF